PAGLEQPADVGRRAEVTAVLVGDPAAREELAQPRLRHAGPARLRAVADIEHPAHARGLELRDELGREQALVADRPEGGHRPDTVGGRRLLKWAPCRRRRHARWARWRAAR